MPLVVLEAPHVAGNDGLSTWTDRDVLVDPQSLRYQ
jgi:hypothetical protein